jgi:hypothetical protein
LNASAYVDQSAGTFSASLSGTNDNGKSGSVAITASAGELTIETGSGKSFHLVA